MPTLHWVGKDKVVNHHHDVPFRLLNKEYTFVAGTERNGNYTSNNPITPNNTTDNSINNRIIHGDNLEALKSLLPEFEGKINCIYIDPPYNTGNENWVYNDNVNDPKIKKWLGQVVGKEGEDLSRHDKWLCMMYPRLKLLHRLLADDGVIFVSIDDNEQASLKLLMDEIFGASNFVENIIWEKKSSAKGVPPRNMMVNVHEYIIAYQKNDKFKFFGEKRDEVKDGFKNPDNDPRGAWRESNIKSTTKPIEQSFTIVDPSTGREYTNTWAFSKESLDKMIAEGRILWKDSLPKQKEFMAEMTNENKAIKSSWGVFDPQSTTVGLKKLLPDIQFDNPKPLNLMDYLLRVGTQPNNIILDSFAGSGTTAHAVLKLNAADGGNRRFILCEMMDYAETITAERVRRVMEGYGEGDKSVAGLGGGFDYFTVGEPLFLEDKNLNEAVGATAIRSYVAYTESIPLEQQTDMNHPVSPYTLGVDEQGGRVLWVFYYEREQVTTLDMDFLATLNVKSLSERPEAYVIYADKCTLSREFMTKHGISFKRIPRDITRF